MPGEIAEFFRQFRPFNVVVVATASDQWFVELVEPLAEKVVLANPNKLRIIAESTKKTDRLDAQVLAQRERLGGRTVVFASGFKAGPLDHSTSPDCSVCVGIE